MRPHEDESVRIERVRRNECTAANALMNEYLRAIGDFVSEEAIEREVLAHSRDGDAVMWLARVGDDAVGMIAVHPLAMEATFEIKRLYVASDARGRGVAKLLMQAAESHARARGAQRMFLDTKETMHQARRLYTSLDYRPVDRYNDDPRVHLHMGKAL